jgi:hypothetical protein
MVGASYTVKHIIMLHDNRFMLLPFWTVSEFLYSPDNIYYICKKTSKIVGPSKRIGKHYNDMISNIRRHFMAFIEKM